MASDEESLKALEGLLNEFFLMRSSNPQKRAIEEILLNFQQQQGAWKHCLYYLNQTSSQYVMMYCLNSLEYVITKRWIGVLGEEKSEIRNALYKFLLLRRDVKNCIKNKLAKLIVDIGRSDWPHFYPDFLNNILELAQNSETTSLGLTLLQTVSEELTSSREQLSMLRKEELRALLLEQVPNILNVVREILERTLDKHRHLVTATPPPSPTHVTSNTCSVAFSSASPLNPSDSLSDMFKLPPGDHCNTFQPLPPLDKESHSLCKQALKCLSQYFSWIPLGSHLTPHLFTTIFQFACFGTEPRQAQHHDVTNSSELGYLAMVCINEIMNKNCVPAQFEDFMLQLFQNTFHLLQRLTREDFHQPSQENTYLLEHHDPNYLGRLTEFIRLFMINHFQRLEANVHFPVLEFLALVFKFTFQQKDSELLWALDVWDTFLEYLSEQIRQRQSLQSTFLDKYKEVLITLATKLMQRVLFKYNSRIMDVGDGSYNDDEKERIIDDCSVHYLEQIGKVSDLMPVETFNIVFQLFEENSKTFLDVEQFFASKAVILPSDSEYQTFRFAMKDLCTALRCIVAHLFHGESFSKHFESVHNLLQRLLHLSSYSSRLKANKPSSLPAKWVEYITDIQEKLLSTLHGFCQWLSQYQNEVLQKGQGKDQYVTLVTSVVDIAIPNITDHQCHERVSKGACQLLISLTTTVRPHFLFSLNSIQKLYSLVTQGYFRNHPNEIQLSIYRALSNMLLLPWPLVSEGDQEWPSRSTHHQRFIQSLTAPFLQLANSSAVLAQQEEPQEQAKPVIQWTLVFLKDQIENMSDYPTRSKQIFFPSLQEPIALVATLLPIYFSQLDVGEVMLDFFLVLFKVLQPQVGVQFTEQTIHTFLNILSRDQVKQCILYDGGTGGKVVEKFLELLQQIVQEPGNAFKVFLPISVDFCINQIYPVLEEIKYNPDPYVIRALFKFFHMILLHNWRYFFKSTVVDTISQSGNEIVQHEEQFTKIMEAFCKSFLQPDIDIFHQNLGALENLNAKWKLYQKGLFRSRMLNSFLSVLVEAMVQRSHDLLIDDILDCVFHLALVDLNNFYQQFLTQYLHSCEGIDNNQRNILAQNFKIHTDHPSFSQNLYHLVNDLRYYRLCNSSLPPGSIRF